MNAHQHLTIRAGGLVDLAQLQNIGRAVLLVDVLNHFLSPLVLDIQIDVWWFSSLPGDEPFEQQVHPDRIDGGNPQAIAYC